MTNSTKSLDTEQIAALRHVVAEYDIRLPFRDLDDTFDALLALLEHPERQKILAVLEEIVGDSHE